MKLFTKKHWVLLLIYLVLGLTIATILLKLSYGEIKIWIKVLTGVVGLLIIYLVSIYANK